MSFPSAAKFLAEGLTPNEALLKAMKEDTRLGWVAIMAVAEAATLSQDESDTCPCCHVKNRLAMLGGEQSVLRHERRGAGVMIDFDPGSQVGGQIARLLGTDAARPIVSAYLASQECSRLEGLLHVGFANCCKVMISPNPDDVRCTAADQILWQSKIDC